MSIEKNKINRRNFLKSASVAGITPFVASSQAMAESNTQNQSEFPQVPRRKFGKTGVDVPILNFGGMFDLVENQIILRNTLKWGINYWDTAAGYAGGNSELGIGKFLQRNPDVRKNLFIVTKASGGKTRGRPDPEKMEARLQRSLERMNTDYVDLYYAVHGMSRPEELTDDLKKWIESAKKRKLIRFAGFSTHKNMEACMQAAAQCDWIDAIMTTYNFRIMQNDEMKRAIDACHKAGIGLVAMKVTAQRTDREKVETDEDKKIMSRFLNKGYTVAQAGIKVSLEDERISTSCVTMNNLKYITENAAAVLDKTKLAQDDKDALENYAQATCSGYCAGCAEICEKATPDNQYISEIMRYLMYYNSYGDREKARKLFAQIPSKVRHGLLKADYSLAEAKCPQRMPIARLMHEASQKLA